MDLNNCLESIDIDIFELCKKEKQRQKETLELIASENFASKAVLQTLSSSFHNKYSEGRVGSRYYGGNEVIDEMESLCQSRALNLFGLKSDDWGVNVQLLSGCPANLAALTALAGLHGRIMGLALSDGGHLSHGYFTPSKKVSVTSLYFESLQYHVNPSTGLIDYEELERLAILFRPKVIIAGISCYSRNLNYERFREICDKVDAILLADMAHVAGLVAGGVAPSPFLHCHVVTSTTHKSLRGPRGGVIFYRRGLKADSKPWNLERRINEAVFPGLQGGPHNNCLAAMAVAFRLAAQPAFKEYQQRVVANCRALCSGLQEKGFKIVTDGTDNHLLLVDFRPQGLNGEVMSHMLDLVNIACNKNTCPGDSKAIRPSGVRLGTPAISSRGFTQDDMSRVVDFISRATDLAKRVLKDAECDLKTFQSALKEDLPTLNEIEKLRSEVIEFVSVFPMPGFEDF